MISLKTHNVLDYVIGVFLVLCPYLFGFSTVDAARNVLLIVGLTLIGYSLLTNYRYSIAKVIPLGVHMRLDVLAGLVLIGSPWIFGYREFISGGETVLHFLLGLGAIALVAITDRGIPRAVGEEKEIDRPDQRRAA